MKIKTSELTGAALDWAVAKCEDETDVLFAYRQYGKLLVRQAGCHETHDSEWPYEPSTDWAQGGPIIEREKLCVGHKHQADPEYCPVNDPATNCWARTTAGGYLSYGPTPLIAVMRCYVASKLGDEVEIPNELIGE